MGSGSCDPVLSVVTYVLSIFDMIGLFCGNLHGTWLLNSTWLHIFGSKYIDICCLKCLQFLRFSENAQLICKYLKSWLSRHAPHVATWTDKPRKGSLPCMSAHFFHNELVITACLISNSIARYCDYRNIVYQIKSVFIRDKTVCIWTDWSYWDPRND